MKTKLFLLTLSFLLGIICHSQKLEFSLGAQLMTKTFCDSAKDYYPPGIFHTKTVTHSNVKALSATEGIHLGPAYLGFSENIQWQNVDCYGSKGYSYFVHQTQGGYLVYDTYTLTYLEKRNTLGLGFNADIDFTPKSSQLHTYLGAQLSGEKPFTKKIIRDSCEHKNTSGSTVAFDSTYAGSPFITFNNHFIFVFSLYLKEQIVINKNFGLNLMIGVRTSQSPIRLDHVEYKPYGFIGSCSIFYTFPLAKQQETEK